VNCNTGGSVQSAVNAALPGDSISVTGTCNENVLIRNDKQRIALDGNSQTATINGPNSSSPTLNVRGKGIVIQGFSITGGLDGVHVNRGSNASINNNNIHNTGRNGISVTEVAFASITNNVIENNPGDGILVRESSSARIGFNSETDTVANANTIQTNGGSGVVVELSASAAIVGNTISSNTNHGVEVINASGVFTASNQMSGNGQAGVRVGDFSSVFLGENSGTGLFRDPNTSTVANGTFGIQCERVGLATGRLSTLNGSTSAKSFGLNLTLTVATSGSSDLNWGPTDEVDDAEVSTANATRLSASVSGSGASATESFTINKEGCLDRLNP
jgi:parallel beta-helix repeat protein